MFFTILRLKHLLTDPIIIFLDHSSSEMELSKALNRLGETSIIRDNEPDDIGTAFQKFAIVTKEMSLLMKNLVWASKNVQNFERFKFFLSL